MAKGNPILGTLQGTIGDVTVYNYNGSQVTRVCRHQIRNPRTNKQAIQRAIATTVSKFVSAFAPVLNNSLQSEPTKVKTLAKIRSLNMNMLRQLAAQKEGTYTPKSTMYVAPNNYIISRGQLTGLTPNETVTSLLFSSNGELVFDLSQLAVEEIGATITASVVFPSIAVGDQITVMAAGCNDIDAGSTIGYCRFAFKDDTTPALLDDGLLRKLNPAAIDLTKAEGDWMGLRFKFETSQEEVDYSGILFGNLINENLDAPVLGACAGVIVSREAGKLRSSARMFASADSDFSLANVYPTYMDGGTPIDIPSEVYLNNDANVI